MPTPTTHTAHEIVTKFTDKVFASDMRAIATRLSRLHPVAVRDTKLIREACVYCLELLAEKPDPTDWTDKDAILFDLTITAMDNMFRGHPLKKRILSHEAVVSFPFDGGNDHT